MSSNLNPVWHWQAIEELTEIMRDDAMAHALFASLSDHTLESLSKAFKEMDARRASEAAPDAPAPQITMMMKSVMADELNKLGIREGSYGIGHDILTRVLAHQA